MCYITIVFALSFFSILEISGKGTLPTKIYRILWGILTLMLMLRFGQGTDYYTYFLHYELIDATGSFFVNALVHGEIGWYMLMLVCKKLGLSFYIFIGIISLIMMFSLNRFIISYSKGPIFSLLLLFPTYYLTYCFSAMRQGLVMTLFLGFGISLLLKRRYLRYYLYIALLTILHTSAIILVVLPFAINWHNKKLIVMLGTGCAFVFVTFMARTLSLFSSVGYEGGAGIMGIAIRILLFYIIWLLHKKVKTLGFEEKEFEYVLYKIYVTGFLVFLVFSSSGLISQRISMPFKAVEIVLLPFLIMLIRNKISYKFNLAKQSLIFFYALVFILNIEFTKNVYSYIDQGNYRSWITPISYPYITVFEKNDIYKYITNFDEEQ